jgi:DNA-binding response OmpR family regulator
MSRSRILVVEDEPEMQDIVKVNLELAGFEVTLAGDGLEAYETMENGRPDALVLDLNLPNMSGFRLLRLMRRGPNLNNVPVIVVTAFAFEEVEDIANERIAGFITKPFDPADLVSKLEYVLSRERPPAGR